MDLNFWLKMPIYSLIGANTNFWHWIMMTFYNLLPLSLVPIGFRCFMGKLIIFCLMNFYFAKMSKKIGSLLFNLPLSKLMSALNTFKLQSPLCLSPCHSYLPFWNLMGYPFFCQLQMELGFLSKIRHLKITSSPGLTSNVSGSWSKVCLDSQITMQKEIATKNLRDHK